MSDGRKRITVVAPAYNEAEGLAHFAEKLLGILDTLPLARVGLILSSGTSSSDAACRHPAARHARSTSKTRAAPARLRVQLVHLEPPRAEVQERESNRHFSPL